MAGRLSVKAVAAAGPGRHFDGDGLHLFVRPNGSKSWVLRLKVHGRRRDMGLGGYPSLGLAEAREQAGRWRAVAKTGGDPIKDRERLAREAEKEKPTVAAVFHECFEARKAQLKGDGQAGRWDSPLRVHVLPKLGKIPVEELDQRDIANTLRPIWHSKASAAQKAMYRLGIVIRHGAAMGLNVDMQATEKARELLGQQRHKVRNTPSMPWQDVPAFYGQLQDGITDLALRLLILTGCRSGEVRGCTVDEIDVGQAVWTIPAARMKMGVEYRVPLSDEALQIISLAMPHVRNGLVFPSPRGGGPISGTAWTMWFRRRGIEARPHGFRSSLRTWLAEVTEAPREIAELCIAHETGSKVERAYRRSDFLEQRRVLMERWAEYIAGRAGNEVLVKASRK